jgi:hypothetical protein
MKTKAFILANWVNYCKEYVKNNNLKERTSIIIKDECSKELAWFISACNGSDSLSYIEKRIEKYNRLAQNDNIGVEAYDPYWKYRLDFLKWIKD